MEDFILFSMNIKQVCIVTKWNAVQLNIDIEATA